MFALFVIQQSVCYDCILIAALQGKVQIIQLLPLTNLILEVYIANLEEPKNIIAGKDSKGSHLLKVYVFGKPRAFMFKI